jgi:hypothetical protein
MGGTGPFGGRSAPSRLKLSNPYHVTNVTTKIAQVNLGTRNPK